MKRWAQIRRIKKQERNMQAASRLLALPALTKRQSAALKRKTAALSAYYGSDKWKTDFAADEAGLLPKDLKRGVLSEDGLYDLLEAYGERNENEE